MVGLLIGWKKLSFGFLSLFLFTFRSMRSNFTILRDFSAILTMSGIPKRNNNERSALKKEQNTCFGTVQCL